ncbi:response regulator [bacterium]|nr:MAG: response regulator [bacterium]
MNRKRLLIVEDEKDMMEMLTFRLEAAGFEVIQAYDGREGLDKAYSQNPDLILLDLMLPGVDGYKVCRELKSDVKYKRIPIAILTARATEKEKRLGLECGAEAYITKPFDPEALMNKIKEMLKEQNLN